MSNDSKDPRRIVEHDILVARRNPIGKQFIRMRASRIMKGGVATEETEYAASENVKPFGGGYRAILNLALGERPLLPNGTEEGPAASAPRGPALATIPLHPDPTASASCTCYLLSPENLSYETAWTAEEWNDQQVERSDNEVDTRDEFEVLLASPAGKVYLVSWNATRSASLTFTQVDLEKEPELWSTLRGGTVAGSVRLLLPTPRIVPVVNVRSLIPSVRA
jgi:hypothetical protein